MIRTQDRAESGRAEGAAEAKATVRPKAMEMFEERVI